VSVVLDYANMVLIFESTDLFYVSAAKGNSPK